MDILKDDMHYIELLIAELINDAKYLKRENEVKKWLNDLKKGVKI